MLLSLSQKRGWFGFLKSPTKAKLLILAVLAYFSTICSYKLSDAIFLIHNGPDSLPYVYSWMGMAMLGVTALLLVLLNRCSVSLLYQGICGTSALFYLFFASMVGNLGYDSYWVYALRTLCYSLFIAQNMFFWAFCDLYFDLQGAKKHFASIATAMYIGYGSGGSMISLGYFSSSELYLITAAVALMSLALTRHISKHGEEIVDHHHEGQEVSQQGLGELLGAIARSPFTYMLMVFNLSTQVLYVIAEGQYYEAFALAFPAGPEADAQEQLTLFIGKVFSLINYLNALVAFFAYGKIVKRFGVSATLLISSSLFVLVFALWPYDCTLFTPLLAMFVGEAITTTFDDNTFHLLLNAVPGKAKNRVRIIVLALLEPMGMVISSFLLLLPFIHSLSLAVALLALALALVVRILYPGAMLEQLREAAIHFGRPLQQWIKGQTKQVLSQIKKEGEEGKLIALEGLLELREEELLPDIFSATHELSGSFKIKFLQALEHFPYARGDLYTDCLRLWLENEKDPLLRDEICFHMAQYDACSKEELLQAQSSSHRWQGAWLVYRLRNEPGNEALWQELLKELEQGNQAMALEILGSCKDGRALEQLSSFLNAEDPALSQEAAFAIANLVWELELDTKQWLALMSKIPHIKSPRVRTTLLQALASHLEEANDVGYVKDFLNLASKLNKHDRHHLEMGLARADSAYSALLTKVLEDPSKHHKSRLLAARVLSNWGSAEFHQGFEKVIKHEADRAFFMLYHAYDIEIRYPEYDLHLLKNALLVQHESILEFIVQLITIKNQVDDVDLVSRSLRSNNPQTRSHGIETLEKFCSYKLFKELETLFNESSVEEKMELYKERGGSIFDLNSLLSLMQRSSDPSLQVVAISLMAQLNFPNWKSLINPSNPSPLLTHVTQELLESYG